MDQLTQKQNEIYHAIVNYFNTYSYFPTIREICEITGRKSTATIKDYLTQLDRKGYITWGGNARKSKIIL